MSKELTSKFTTDEARELTDELVRDYAALRTKIGVAWQGKIWLALGYSSWTEYVDVEFQGISLRPPKDLEDEVVHELRQAGMSTRGIAAATDIPDSTVARKVQGVTAPNGAVLGNDNRTQPATKSTSAGGPQEEVVDAEIVDVEIVEPLESGEDRPAADLGFEPIELSTSSEVSIGWDRVNRLITDLHAGGSAPLRIVKSKAQDLETAFTSGALTPEELNGERIEGLGRDVADALAVLSDLLAEMADGRGTQGATADALAHRDTVGSVKKAQTNLREVAQRLDPKAVTA